MSIDSDALEEALRDAFDYAIAVVGFEVFRQTSLFGSNHALPSPASLVRRERWSRC